MTNKEALEILDRYKKCSDAVCPPVSCDECECPYRVPSRQFDDAMQVALDALHAQEEKVNRSEKTNSSEDLISRDEAIDAMKKLYDEDLEAYGCEIPEMFNCDRAIEALKELPSVQPESCGDAVSRNAIIRALNTMDRYVSDELTLCNTYIKFPKNEVFIVDDVYEEIAENLPSVQPEQGDAEFWRKRSDEYEKMFFDLYWRMMNGVKFESMQFDKNGITLKMREPSQEDNT